MLDCYQPRKSKRDMLATLDVVPVKSTMPARNTLDYTLADGTRRIRLHQTDVVTIHPNGGVTLNTGGWNSHTTRARINEFAPAHIGVYTDKGNIHVNVTTQWETRESFGGGTYQAPKVRHAYPFRETVYIGPRGGVKSDTNGAALARDRNRIDSFMRHVKRNGLPADAAGDPWVLGVVSASTMWDWVDSHYFTRTFYALALQKAGMQPQGIAWAMHDIDAKGGKLDKTDLSRIRRYIRACVGLAT